MYASEAELSDYARTFGALHDGHVGHAQFATTPVHVLDGLHKQIIEALGVPSDSDDAKPLCGQLKEILGAEDIERNRIRLRSAQGHRITAQYGGRERTIDLRLAHRDPRLRTAENGGSTVTQSVVEVERVAEGEQSFSTAETSGNVRTVPLPWTLIRLANGQGALRWADPTVTLSVTHNQLVQKAGVDETFRVSSTQRFTGPVYEVELDGMWQVRVDTPGEKQGDWLRERSHGRITAVFPAHYVLDSGTDPADLPEPAAVDDIPLWHAESIGDPRRLHTELLAHEDFAPLLHLDSDSAQVLEDFLSARQLTGTAQQQSAGGVSSPILRDTAGCAVGWLQCAAVIEPGRPVLQCPDGTSLLETQFAHGVSVDQLTRLTSGIGVEGTGGPTFTTDHAQGHPQATERFGGTLRGRIGGTWKTEEELSAAGSSTLMHGARTTGSQVLTPARVTYRMTLHRSGGGKIRATFGPWEDGLKLMLPARTVLEGRRPAPHEVRELPEGLACLDGIGISEMPFKVEGTDETFDKAEAWLRQEGFLPPVEHRSTNFLMFHMYYKRLHEAQLVNLGKFEHLRTRHGLEAAMREAVDGSRSFLLERPNLLTGPRRVRLLFTTRGDTSRKPVHTRIVPDIQTTGSSSHVSAGSRSNRRGLVGAIGGGGGVDIPIKQNPDVVNVGPDYAWMPQSDDTVSSTGAVGHEQRVETKNGSHVFTVPTIYELDVYEGESRTPLARFGDARETNTSGTGADAPAGQARLNAATGTLSLLVPGNRTRPPATPPLPTGPRPSKHLIRQLVVDGMSADDRRRIAVLGANGRPPLELFPLPEGAVVQSFRAAAAIKEALELVADGTFPRRSEPGASSRAAGRVIAAAVNRLPARWKGVDHRLGEYMSALAGSPLGRVGQLLYAAGLTTAYKRLSVAVAGASRRDTGTVAAEAQYAAIQPAQLIAQATTIFGGSCVMEGLPLPGLAVDQLTVMEIEGYLHSPRHMGAEEMTSEQGTVSTDSQGRELTAGRAHQATLTGLHRAGDPDEKRAYQSNSSVRYGHVRRTEKGLALLSESKETRTPTHSGTHHLIGADAILLVTVRRGVRNGPWNTLGQGESPPVTLAIDIPRAVTFAAPEATLARHPQQFGRLEGLTLPALPEPSIPLPDRFVRTREVGAAGVLSVTQQSDDRTRVEQRDRVHQELTALVEKEAPGSTRPGHASYLPGVATEVRRCTTPSALRSLPGRGPQGTRFQFVYVAWGGARLLEVALSTEPAAQTPELREVRGVPLDTGGGLIQGHTDIRTRDSTVTTGRTNQLALKPVVRYPRPGTASRTDRAGLPIAMTAARDRSRRSRTSDENGIEMQTGSAADFQVPYDVTMSVRSGPITAWPPNLLGGTVQAGVLAAADLTGPAAQWPAAWARQMLSGRPERTGTVPTMNLLRFPAAETVEPRKYRGPRPPALLEQSPSPAQCGTARLVPSQNVMVHGFNAGAKLNLALRQVAPVPTASWGLTTEASPAATATRLGELIMAGQGAIDPPRATADLLPPMPGSWPLEPTGDAARLSVELYDPRPVTEAGDIVVARARRHLSGGVSESSAGNSFALGIQATVSLEEGNRNLLAFTLPLIAQQPHVVATGATTTRAESTRMSAGRTEQDDDRPGTRTHEALVDMVITVRGPQGVRYVTGTATMALSEADLLGFGVTGPRPGAGIYDLPAMLADQDGEDRRDWTRYPVIDLPKALASAFDERDSSIQLWLAPGDDPDGVRLARALFTASRTAVQAGKPVELVIRTGDGPRHWPFNADGTLNDTTGTTRDAWQALRDTAETYTAAVSAKCRYAVEEGELTQDRSAAAEASLRSEEIRQTADAECREVHTAHLQAISQAGIAREAADAAVREAEAELSRAERALKQAAGLPTATQVTRARLAWRQAQAEALHAERMASSGRTLPARDALRERAEDAHHHWAGLEERHRGREIAREALTAAKSSVDEEREKRAGRARESETTVAEARIAEERAARTLERRTAECEDDRKRLSDIEHALGDAGTHQQYQRERQASAWQEMPRRAVELDSARRAEGAGVPTSFLGVVTSRPTHPSGAAIGSMPAGVTGEQAFQRPSPVGHEAASGDDSEGETPVTRMLPPLPRPAANNQGGTRRTACAELRYAPPRPEARRAR